MPLRGSESAPQAHLDVTIARSNAVAIHDDAEQLIQIVGGLLCALEQQICSVEQNVASAQSEWRASGQTMLKEQCIRAAVSLNALLKEIVQHLDERTEHPSLSGVTRVTFVD